MPIPDFFRAMMKHHGWTELEHVTVCYMFGSEPQQVVGTLISTGDDDDDQDFIKVIPDETVEIYEGETPDEAGLLQINTRHVVTLSTLYGEEPNAE